MLRVDIRQIGGVGAATHGSLSPGDPALEGLDLELAGPVEVEGRLQGTSAGDYLWRGHLRAVVSGHCRRCLSPLEQVIDEPVDVVFSPDPEMSDDPSVYTIAPEATQVDVTTAVREELALRASAFPLCREDCRGLCPECGADLNAGACTCASSGSTS